MAALDIPGLVILVREGDLTRFELALGSTDLAGRHPVVPAETAFRIGSLTKLVTTWLALDAARDGKISLDASLATYLPELQDAPPGAVTIRELLAHRSGLPEVEPRDLRLSGTSTWLGRVASLERERHPGFAYRNLDHALVGEALLRVHETTWPELVRARAGAAVGLDIHADLAIEARISPGHPRWPGGTQRMSVTHRAMLSDGPLAAAFTHPSGGLVATADALARLVRALTTSREAASSRRETASLQVSPDTRALLLTRTSSADEPCWTLGFACLDRGAALPAVLRHAGNTGDSSAEVWADPATDRVVVVLANAPEFPRNAALAAVQRYLELDPESIRMAYTRGHPVGPGMELPP
jgi:CubicO group peptidase (beta-lactamase class C family)